jgi:eukaryotic-like serine/threonine-protein kinase
VGELWKDLWMACGLTGSTILLPWPIVASNAPALSAPISNVAPTIEAPAASAETRPFGQDEGGKPASTAGNGIAENVEEGNASIQIRFRRALAAGFVIWCSFAAVDWMVVRLLDAGTFSHFVALRVATSAVVLPTLWRLHRSPPPSPRLLNLLETACYTSAATSIGLMCVEFRGLASPYASGLSLLLLVRTVSSQDPWRRGLVSHGVPIAAYYLVLLGSAFSSAKIAMQLHDAASLGTLFLNTAFILGTYLCLVVCGSIVWSLRRQLFEARSLGRYRLKHRLASGGMGDVWAAYHPGLKRDVAVKVLRVDAQERSAGAVTRFEREVRATAELQHPNTVRVFDYGTTEDGLCYYVMELLEGETLRSHVDRLGPLPPARAVHIMGQAARAIGEAHERGIIHRDIKPENLFLTSLGGEHDFVKVIDFGIAKVNSAHVTMTRTGWVLGTPEYMSPEVAVGKAADSRSDVYALGAVLYFLLCGRPPFVGENAGKLFFAHATETPLLPSAHVGHALPGDLEALVMRALHKDPDERFSSASELALALASCRLAGKWTFGDATYVARHSSRPPPAQSVDQLVGPPPLRAPSIQLESSDDSDDTTLKSRVG